MKGFGATIRALREEKQISLRKFAETVGISPTYQSKVEREEFPPPGEETIKRMAGILGKDSDELLSLAGKVPSDLPEIIQEHPHEMAAFLRTARGLPPEALQKLVSHARKLK